MDILEPGIRSDFGQEPDMADILDAEMFGSPCGLPTSDNYMDNDDWLDRLFEDPVLNDKMITEAVQPPRIQSEHSYSMHNDPIHASGLELPKLEDFADEMDTEFFGSSSSPLDLSQKAPSSPEQTVTVKQEMAVEDFVFTQSAACPTSTSSITFANDPRPPTIVLATGKANSILQPKSERFFLPKTIKLEPADIDHHSSDSGLDLLPPTPPSSASSDSEGSLSPGRSAPSSPIRESKHHTLSKPFSQPLFTSPIPTSGILILSEEEKRTLITEGYPVPSKLPLTKQEEKNLKKIRRKIKNKISAQESRRKKKEYLETLEKRVENYTQENNDLKRKVDSLENNNRSLLNQLQKLQAIVGKITRPSATTTQTGTVLMVVVLCFAIFVGGGWAPLSLNVGYSSGVSGPAEGEGALFSNPRPVHPGPTMGPLPQRVRVMEQYSTPTKKSRVLLSLKDDIDDLYGPRVPDSGWRCDQSSESENLEYTPAVESVRNLEDTKDGEVVKQTDNTNTPTVESGTILEKTPAAETQSTGQVVTLDPRVLTENQTSDGGDSQALMHPDISAPADFLSADHLLNATAVNESA